MKLLDSIVNNMERVNTTKKEYTSNIMFNVQSVKITFMSTVKNEPLFCFKMILAYILNLIGNKNAADINFLVLHFVADHVKSYGFNK